MNFRELLLTPNIYSRPRSSMQAVLALVMHYTQAPGWSAEKTRDYFESLKTGIENRWASAHYAVDPEEVIRMIPHSEIAYHCGSGSAYPVGYTQTAISLFGDYPNLHSIGIEMCVGEDGEIDPRTVDNARMVATVVCLRNDLNPMSQIIRHYDVTGKICPRSWVERPEDLESFRDSVKLTMVNLRERGRAA